MRTKLLAEIVGTFILVFAGTAAVVFNHLSNGAITHPGIALVFGLVVLALAYTFGDVSGAHINPAVTLGFAVAKRLPWREVPGYIAAQCLGALLASGLLYALFPDGKGVNFGATIPFKPVFATECFVLEIWLTWALMLVILHVSTGAKEKGSRQASPLARSSPSKRCSLGDLRGFDESRAIAGSGRGHGNVDDA